MQPDMMQQLQRQAEHLGQLARDLAAAAPQRTEGTDATGWVRIVLGPGGLPAEIRIRDGWQQRLDPGHLGAAVLEANTDALQRAMQAWTGQLDKGRWWMRRADTDDGSASPIAPTVDLPAGRVRESAGLVEDMLTALHAVQHAPAAASASKEGKDSTGHVSVTVGPGGLTGCTIDPKWAVRREGATISAALAAALARALALRPPAARPGGDIDALVGDALATLAALTTPPGATGGAR